MAREQRKDVDYFPHDCSHGRKMHIIETKYGNDGYSTWFKLLEQLGKANNHYIDISNEMNLMYLTSTFKISEEKTLSILGDLAKLGAIDKLLFEEYNVIFSLKFIESIRDAYRQRKNKIIEYNDVLIEIKHKNGQSIAGLTPVGDNTAEVIRKEKKSKVKEIKEEESIEEKEKNVVANSELNSEIKNENHLNAIVLKSSEQQSWLEAVAMQNRKTPDEIKTKIDDFVAFLITVDKIHKSKREFLEHFINWLKKNIENPSPDFNNRGPTANPKFSINQ